MRLGHGGCYIITYLSPGGSGLGKSGLKSVYQYSSYGILNHTRHTIYAKFNTWAHNPPTSGVDFWNSDETGGGNIVWQ